MMFALIELELQMMRRRMTPRQELFIIVGSGFPFLPVGKACCNLVLVASPPKVSKPERVVGGGYYCDCCRFGAIFWWESGRIDGCGTEENGLAGEGGWKFGGDGFYMYILMV